jgi:N-dimethylarginine dimethylaminohydrolase
MGGAGAPEYAAFMSSDKTYARAAELPAGFRSEALETRAPESAVLMVTPEHFRVEYVINPHMRGPDGRPKQVDRELAAAQWTALRDSYAALGYTVFEIPGDPACPDMVFAANQSFPFADRQGRRRAILSQMHAPERRAEVAHFARFYTEHGYAAETLAAPGPFEGMGDALWVPRRRGLLAGCGFRTSRAAAESLAPAVGAPAFLLELEDERFYHLDTAVAPLDERRCLVYPRALAPASLELLAALFPELIVVDEREAVDGLACNAHCPDGLHVLIDAACTGTAAELARRGYRVLPHDLSELKKSGGSVFCMKVMLP